MDDWVYWTPDDDDVQNIKQSYETGGVAACMKYYSDRINDWKSVKINMAVIGGSGVGKSTLINAVRGIASDHKLGAKVGVTETTMECRPYAHPDNDQLLFWDIPGVGTPLFLKDEYLEKIDVDIYDCFMILSAARFTENDAWLGKELAQRRKIFYYVRTKIGDDIRSDKHEKKSNNKPHVESDVLDEILGHTLNQLEEQGLDARVFLIDSHKPLKYDFSKLQHQIIKDLPRRQKEAMIMSLTNFSHSLIKEKIIELKSRAWKAAIISAAIAAVPVPGMAILVDLKIISDEASYYKKQLGLDEESLRQRATTMNVDHQSLVKRVAEEFPDEFNLQYIKSIAVGGVHIFGAAVEEFARFIPLLGSVIAAPISLAATKYVLQSILNKMEKLSIEITERWATSVDDDSDSD